MNIQHLKTFCIVAKTGSFTKASKILYLTQPAVTAQIKSLESYLGVILFERNRVSKKTSLTYEGEKLLTYAERIFALIDEMEIALEEMKTLHQGGKVAIGTTAVIGIYFLPQIFRQFRIQYPEVVIDNRIGNSQKILEMILASFQLAEVFCFNLISNEKPVLSQRSSYETISPSSSSLSRTLTYVSRSNP